MQLCVCVCLISSEKFAVVRLYQCSCYSAVRAAAAAADGFFHSCFVKPKP